MSYKYIDIRPNPKTGIGTYQRGFSIKDLVDMPQVEHRRIGGAYRAKFRIYANDRNLAEDLLFLGAGREIKIYNDKGIVDFGGMIYVVTLNTGGSKVRASLLETSNRVWARWQEAGTANAPDRSAVFNNTDSRVVRCEGRGVERGAAGFRCRGQPVCREAVAGIRMANAAGY